MGGGGLKIALGRRDEAWRGPRLVGFPSTGCRSVGCEHRWSGQAAGRGEVGVVGRWGVVARKSHPGNETRRSRALISSVSPPLSAGAFAASTVGRGERRFVVK
jgi:hypothetical protein